IRFADWNPLLTMYGSRGIWKFEIGDRESALADLIHYEELAEKAAEGRQHQRKEISSRTVQQDNKIIIRMGDDDLVDHLAAYNFDDQHYEMILRLADMFAGRAEKEKALEYYDKALAIAQKEDRTESHLALFSAAAEIPFRKGHMVMQFHEHENALPFFDLAAQELTALLKTDQKQHFAAMEKRLAEVARYRAEVLQHLGRHEEANQAIDEMQKIYSRTAETEKISQAARSEKADKMPLADTFKSLKKTNRTPNQNFGQNKGKVFEEDLQQEALNRLTVKHNEAATDCRRGNIELDRKHWKTAIKYFLKARSVFDSKVFSTFEETQNNLCSVYAGLGAAYLAIERYDDSERWFNKAITQTQKLINEGKLDLQPAFCETLEGLAILFSNQKKYEEALRQLEKVFNERNRLVAENLEGLNVEYLRTRDHQRLAPSALLLQLQNKTIRNIEKILCSLDRIDDAILWGKREVEIFEQFLGLLPDPTKAYYDQCLAFISYTALLLLGKRYEEADALVEKSKQKLAEFKDDEDDPDLAEKISERINQLIFIRLFDILGKSKYHFKKESISQANQLTLENKGEEALLILESLKEPIRQHQIEAQNDHWLWQQFWEEIEKTVDKGIERTQKDVSEWIDHVWRTSPFERSHAKENDVTVTEDEESSEELDQELAQYENEFGGDNVNDDFLYQMMDEMTGNTKASDMMRKYYSGQLQIAENGQPFRNENTVGRNDPCPCGSGKKYKKCCMKQN
ncbi:MAG: SEC-C domain-containing protein, partial [Planctomycetaceae bacterium]|nr:SEC-C domain-containing protein [Planctomycetaceae bacterium]